MDTELKNKKRPHTDNSNHNENLNKPKREKREMPALEVLNYLDDSTKESMFYSALNKKDLEMVKFLVENSQVNFDTVSNKKYVIEHELMPSSGQFFTPVLASIIVNSYDLTEYFLTKKFQTVFTNPENGQLFNAMLAACIMGNFKIAQLVIDYDQKALLPISDLPLPIILAAQFNHDHVIEVLQKNGVDVNALCSESKKTALHAAAQSGACDAVKMLIKLGANIDALDVDNYTPLSLAVKHDKFEVVKELLNNGANLFMTSADNNTNAVRKALQRPLHHAVNLLQLLSLENNFGKNRIEMAVTQENFDITVIPQNVMNELKLNRSEILKGRAILYLLGKLLTDQGTKAVATAILEGIICQGLDLQQSTEDQEKALKQNQEFITGMKIFSHVPDEPKRKILSFLCPSYLLTHTALESKKALEIADVVFSCRYAKK